MWPGEQSAIFTIPIRYSLICPLINKEGWASGIQVFRSFFAVESVTPSEAIWG